jgi:response regulator RpfG family c-di-GMP phosphodiesterase
MVETRREMSLKSSNSRRNLYERLRRVLRRDTFSQEIWTGATIDLCAQVLDACSRQIASHCSRVAELASRLTQQFDSGGKREVDIVHTAGWLHDLGMIGIRDDILNKVGPLSEDEWEIVRRHPDIGADILAQHPALAAVAPIVRHHHERWDGSGYPAGLKGDVVPTGARIVAVAESFDFITNKWIYRPKPLSTVDAIRDISEHSGSWYDPAVVDALHALYM